MVEVRGFHGLRFDANKTGALDDVLTPPYDVIGASERKQLAACSPYNMTHLILPESDGGENAYDKAARLFRAWIADGVLMRDSEPSLYLLRQQFTDFDGETFKRRAFFALLKLPEPEERFILGHERTFNTPVEDRLALLRAAQANLEPIFVMYSDPGNKVEQQLFRRMYQEPPLFRAGTSDNVTQELWRAPCPEYLIAHLQEQTLYIADGHHRFKTACVYRDECRDRAGRKPTLQNYDYVMAGFVAFEEPGLKIYAAHRVLSEPFSFNFDDFMTTLAQYFQCRELSSNAALPRQSLEKELADENGSCVFIMYARGRGVWLLSLKEEKRMALVGNDRSPSWQSLDVAVLHRGILERLLGIDDDGFLIYEKDAHTATTLVANGKAALAFLLRPARPEQVRACAEDFEPMPQKSTYFFPKLPSGAVIYSIT